MRSSESQQSAEKRLTANQKTRFFWYDLFFGAQGALRSAKKRQIITGNFANNQRL